MEAQPPGENNGKREARKCQERGAACIRKYPKAKHQGRESSVCYFRILAVSDNSSFQFSFALPCLVSSNKHPFRTFLPRQHCTRLAPATDPCARLLLTAFYNFRSPEPVTCCQTKHLPGAKASHRAFVLLYRHTRSLSCLLGFTIAPFDLIASFLWHLLYCCPSVTAISMTARTVGMAVIGGGAV